MILLTVYRILLHLGECSFIWGLQGVPVGLVGVRMRLSIMGFSRVYLVLRSSESSTCDEPPMCPLRQSFVSLYKL